MWYPGVSTFAETSCIAAIEAQACGTPFVGSYRGALPETIPSGILIKGHHESPEYQRESIAAVIGMLKGCAESSFDYRRRVTAGRAHVASYSHTAIAAEWDAQIATWFRERYEGNKLGVLRQLLHEDDHVSARQVAKELVGGHGFYGATAPKSIEEGFERASRAEHDWPVYDEALEAELLCDRVIAGKEHTAEDYGIHAMHDVVHEAKVASRFKVAIPAFEQRTRILDVACGNGSFALALAWANPTIAVHGVDFSDANIARARAAAEAAGIADRVTFQSLTVYDFDRHTLHAEMDAFLAEQAGTFDGVFCGEFIEHVANYRALIDGLERAVGYGAPMVYTCPHGAYQEIAALDQPIKRSHVHRFHHDDLQAVFGHKAALSTAYLSSGMTPRGNDLGSWIVCYQHQPNRPTGERPFERIPRTRPMPRLTVGLITKDAAHDLGRCLASVRHIADEILVGDTGSTDRTVALAQEMGARVLALAPVEDQPEGFAGARNLVLEQASGEWFLWIDADEELIHPAWLRRYLDSSVFHGFVLQQTHLYMDGAPTHDIPVRVFRNTGRVQFFGCVHEQPQDGDCNTDIHPSLDVSDIRIAHWGYLTADRREYKRVKRNLPLLQKDQRVFPDRLLGQVLCVREAVLQADAMRAAGGGAMTNAARDGYLFAIQIHRQHFDDPAHKYHALSRLWYEIALKQLGLGWEQEIALAGRQGGMEHRRAHPERVWVRDAEEYERVVAHRAKGLADKMRPPRFLTDPDDARLGLPREQRIEATA
jgi:glycosyltransferase involved in cell wall biosynthesis/2-polyprenyl-3-methyl-5-hydroxy-6-metoxy-1,4-benzoquinol methylase